MTKLEIEAIRALPPDFVADGTSVASVGRWVVALNPAQQIIAFDGKQWGPLRLDASECAPESICPPPAP